MVTRSSRENLAGTSTKAGVVEVLCLRPLLHLAEHATGDSGDPRRAFGPKNVVSKLELFNYVAHPPAGKDSNVEPFSDDIVGVGVRVGRMQGGENIFPRNAYKFESQIRTEYVHDKRERTIPNKLRMVVVTRHSDVVPRRYYNVILCRVFRNCGSRGSSDSWSGDRNLNRGWGWGWGGSRSQNGSRSRGGSGSWSGSGSMFAGNEKITSRGGWPSEVLAGQSQRERIETRFPLCGRKRGRVRGEGSLPRQK